MVNFSCDHHSEFYSKFCPFAVTSTSMDACRHQLSSLFLLLVLSLFITSSTSVQLTVSPYRMNALIGDRAEFLCSYTPDYAYSCDDTFVFWGKKGEDTIANMTYVINPTKYDIVWQSRTNRDGDLRCLYTLIIKDVRNSDGGQYSCALIRPQSDLFHIIQALAKLQVVIPPPAIYPICQTSVIAGQSLTHGMMLVCESLIGQPAVTLKWVSGDYELPAELHKLNNNKLLQLKTTMTVDTKQLNDPVIMCVMELPDPIEETRTCSINTSTTVSVRSTRVENSTAQIATFICHVTTNIPYKIEWLLNNQPITAEDPNDRFFVENKAQALHIRDLTTKDDRGTVTCHVATMFGNFTGTAILDIDAYEKKEPIIIEGDNVLLMFGLIFGILTLLVVLNILIILVWCRCKRRLASNHSAKSSSKRAEEGSPLSPTSNSHFASNNGNKEVVTEMEIRSENKYLDMSKPVKKVAAVNNSHYSPMKSINKATDDDDVYIVPINDNVEADDNEYMVSSKSDDADTYMYSSTDDLNKTNGKNTPKPVVKSKPKKPLEAISSPSEVKTGHGNGGKKVFERSKTGVSDNDDANDYEVLVQDKKQKPGKPKLNRMASEVEFQQSPPSSAKSSPKLTRNCSAPLLSQEPPEYAIPNDSPSPISGRKEAPVYEIPNNENSCKSPSTYQRTTSLEKTAEKSPSPLLKLAMRPPVAHKKPFRNSDPPSSSDNEPCLKKLPTRISLPQGESSDRYLIPSVSQQNLDQIKPVSPMPKESKSPLLKKVKKPLKPKNNNTETYQCLDRQSMDIEKPDYQILLGLRKVDECQLYENV